MSRCGHIAQVDHTGRGGVVLDVRQGSIAAVVSEKIQSLSIIAGKRLGVEGLLKDRIQKQQEEEKMEC